LFIDDSVEELFENKSTLQLQSNVDLNISKFPQVKYLPLELYPFNKKVRMAEIAQRRNEKKFIRDQLVFYKHGFKVKYRKELED
jgi:hypothetical protein